MTHMILPLVLVSAFALGCDDRSGSRGSSTSRKKSKASVASVQVPPVAPVAPVAPVPPVIAKVEPVQPPTPKPPLVRITGIRSDKPQSTPEKAFNDAIQVAQYRLMESLQKLDPPVMVKPSLAKIRNEYVPQKSIRETQPTAEQKEKFKEQGVDSNRYWIELDVELTETQVQRLRSTERVSDGIRGAGLVLALVAAAYGFLRLDAWSKGYLTLWLALAAAAIVAAASYGLAW